MSLSSLEKLIVFDYTQQILSQDLLTNSLFSGGEVGQNLRSLIFKKNRAQINTYPSDEAISGRLRADAAGLAQGARNVKEASSMFGIASNSMASIEENLTLMKEVAEDYKNGDLTESQAKAEYLSLADQIDSLVESSDFNGISLLNGNDWSGDDRVSVSGNSGRVYIQAYNNSGFDVAFSDQSDLIGKYYASDLNSVDTAISTLTSDLEGVSSLQESYENQESGLAYQSQMLESNAEIMEDAANNRRTHDSSSNIDEMLVDYLQAVTGKIVDSST